DAEGQVARILREPAELAVDVLDVAAVDGQQGRMPSLGQQAADLVDDRRTAPDVGRVVQCRVAQPDEVAHGLSREFDLDLRGSCPPRRLSGLGRVGCDAEPWEPSRALILPRQSIILIDARPRHRRPRAPPSCRARLSAPTGDLSRRTRVGPTYR